MDVHSIHDPLEGANSSKVPPGNTGVTKVSGNTFIQSATGTRQKSMACVKENFLFRLCVRYTAFIPAVTVYSANGKSPERIAVHNSEDHVPTIICLSSFSYQGLLRGSTPTHRIRFFGVSGQPEGSDAPGKRLGNRVTNNVSKLPSDQADAATTFTIQGCFDYQQEKVDQMDGSPAMRLLAALRHKLPDGQREPVWLQTFADPDGADELYVIEKKTAKSDGVRHWQLRGLPADDGKVKTVKGVTERCGSVTLAELGQQPYKYANLARVGVFFSVNVLTEDAKRRKAENVARVAAVFVDLDGVPLPEHYPIEPTAIVESSRGRYHVYWAVDGVPLDEFRTLQQGLARLYGGDMSVCDLSRVMRLPGYWHGKKEPGHLVRLISCNADNQYTRADLLEAWPELGETLAAAKVERERKQQEAERRRAEADQLRQQIATGTAGSRAEVQRKYGQIALTGCCATLLEAGEGSRNNTLNAVAYRAGRLVGAGVLVEADAAAALREIALQVGLEAGEITTTLASGLQAGKAKPVEASKIGQFIGVRKSRRVSTVDLARERVESVPEKDETPAARYFMPSFPVGTDEATDEANALILAANGANKLLRYRFGQGWYFYDRQRGVWREDDAKLTRSRRLAGKILRKVIGNHAAKLLKCGARDAEIEPILEWRKSAGNNKAITNVLTAAAGLPEFITEPDDWNRCPDLLNCKNGVLDLATGQLRPHDPDDLLTWQTGAAYDPTARHKYVDQLVELLKRDGRHDFLQRSAGSTLYGKAPNEKVTVLYGEGGTGKGTLVSSVTAMLGDYAYTLEVKMLLVTGDTGGTGPKPELLKLQGKRLVVAGEPPKDARFDAGRLKGMTGNDTISARGMHSNIILEFKPVFKVWIHSNYPINTPHDDTGMQRRLIVVPFRSKPENPSDEFKDTLETDPTAQSALLNWAYKGFRAWRDSKFDLGMSTEIEAATAGYWKEQNPYEKFADTRLSFEDHAEIAGGALKAAFENWAEENGVKLGKAAKIAELYTYLGKRGLKPRHTRTGNVWDGVGLAVNPVKAVNPESEFSAQYTRYEEEAQEQPSRPSQPSRDDVAPAAGKPGVWEDEAL